MKFKITDECGKDFSAEKREHTLQAPRRFKEEPLKKDEPVQDAEKKDFSEEEIKLLKKLIKKADALLELLDPEEDNEEAEEEVEVEEKDASVEEFDADEELLEIPEDEEGVQDSEDCEEKEGVAAHDSKKSYGAIERKSNIDDSIDIDTEIAQAWAKRYGGNK